MRVKKFSKFIVSLVVFLNVVFTAIVLYIFKESGQEPTSLIVAWFAFTTGELFALAFLKKKEIECDKKGDIDEY